MAKDIPLNELSQHLEDSIKKQAKRKMADLALKAKLEIEKAHEGYDVIIEETEDGTVIKPSDQKKAMDQEFNMGKKIWTLLISWMRNS